MKNKIDKIRIRIASLQKACLALQEKQEHDLQEAERQINESALKVIDILDMIESICPNASIEGTPPAPETCLKVIRKCERRLLDVLSFWQTNEIQILDNEIRPGEVRVLDTVDCRKGYQRKSRILRPADVICSASDKVKNT